MSLEPEPQDNPNPRLMVDPPLWLRFIMRRVFGRVISPEKRAERRVRVERERTKAGIPHRIEYFHQLDDPYSYLAMQTLARLVDRYDIELVPHLIRASGGKNQPELEKLAVWARRDAELIAPHYGLEFPTDAPVVPDQAMAKRAASILAAVAPTDFSAVCVAVTKALWAGDGAALDAVAIPLGELPDPEQALTKGNERLSELGHYSGATFHYGGEWFWGADRLFYLEQWLRDVGACNDPEAPFICPRPDIDVSGVDASGLTLDFYPSLNSPYTSIIYDRTIAMARECGIRLNHKPVLPMIMRGVPATRQKGTYIGFDTKREAEHLGVDFGPVATPIGEPTRLLYSLLPWAAEQGKDIELLSAGLRLAWAEGVHLSRNKGLRKAVEQAGLNWNEAQLRLGSDDWKEPTARNQLEMSEELGLWGVPSYRLSGPDGAEDLRVWGQDRLWLVAAEIRRRTGRSG